MSTGRDGSAPKVQDVLSAVSDAAKTLGVYVTHTVDERPGVTLAAALAAGFVVGGGLISPLGARLVAATARATAGNVATLITLDVIRRALEGGGHRGSGQSADPR